MRSVIFLNVNLKISASLFPYSIDFVAQITTFILLTLVSLRLIIALLNSYALSARPLDAFAALVDKHTAEGEQDAEDEDQQQTTC